MNQYSQFVFDDESILKNAGLVAASAAGSLVLDVGEALLEGKLVIDVSAIEVASGDELYRISLQGSTAEGFDDVQVELASVVLGADAGLESNDSEVGRYVVPFRNEKNGNLYRYLRIYTTVSGNVATGINYVANLVK